jgi:hypothetical protein
MGNSTKTLQSIVDSVTSIGDLALNLPVGGWGNEPSLTIANDVMTELLSKKFPWKWNRKVVAPFYTNTLQHDYAQVSLTDVGWIENASLIDINSTSLPKRLEWLEAVRDLARSSQSAGRPMKICWLPNDQLVQGVWPGAGKTYTNPVGAVALPDNPTTNILDANGNILVLTTYGVTGGVAPVAIVSAAAGTQVADGTCVWTVANPKAAGFRLLPLQSGGIVWQVNVVAQMKPPAIVSLSQKVDPVPDDHVKYFRDGFKAKAHQYSTAPAVRARFPNEHLLWMKSLEDVCKGDDREKEDAAFTPATTIMGGPISGPIGPGNPYGPE